MRLLVKTRPTRLPTPDPRSKPKFDVARHRRSKGHYTTALRLAGVEIFGENHALEDVNLDVESDELVVIVGPSGDSKSTPPLSTGLEKPRRFQTKGSLNDHLGRHESVASANLAVQ